MVFTNDDPSVEAVRSRHLLSGGNPGTGRSKYDGRWYSTKQPLEFYAYSAFFDDRHSLRTLPFIRIIAVSQYLDGRNIHCLFYYKDRSQGHMVPASTLDIGAGIIRHGKGFKEYIVSCPLDSEDVPANVTVVLDLSTKPDWLMPVEVPLKTGVIKHEFVTCVSVTYWNQNPFQVVEWMEMLNELGVSKVVIYNNSLTDEAARVFRYYDKAGFVDFRQSWNFIDRKSVGVGKDTCTQQSMSWSQTLMSLLYQRIHTNIQTCSRK